MFTGIVEEVGIVDSIKIQGKSGSITIKADKVLENTKLGDSIAVNGICLTVTNIYSDRFTADIMAETVRRSGMSAVNAKDKVNLERAMALNGRFGGHIVSGHIDGTGKIIDYKREENAVWVTISASEEILNLIVEKGSICIDGISLTVAEVTDDYFNVSVIPHTAENTTLLNKKIGNIVNLENDIVGKYIQKFMKQSEKDSSKKSNLTMEMLVDMGY